MMTNRLPPIPTDDQLAKAGEEFGQMLVDKSAPVERRFIRQYGQSLIDDHEPSYTMTVTFHRELADLAPRLTGYGVQLARMSLCTDLISDLQCRIALYVARSDAAQGVS